MGFQPSSISKLSQLAIDTSKDWAAQLIKNLGAGVDPTDAVQRQQVILQALLTTQGDMIYRGASVAARLAGAPNPGVNADPSTGTSFMHFNLTTGLPEWSDIAALIGKWFAVVKLTIPGIPGMALAAVESHAGGGFTAAPGLTVPAPPTLAKATALSPGNAVGGFVKHSQTGPVDLDETTAANNATANDMDLCPNPIGAVGDGCYFGYATPWDWLLVTVDTAKVGTLSVVWKYWNGSSWVALSILYDEVSSWSATGKKRVHFIRPGDWAASTIALLTNYWIKAEVQSGYALTSYPLGTQAWIGQY